MRKKSSPEKQSRGRKAPVSTSKSIVKRADALTKSLLPDLRARAAKRREQEVAYTAKVKKQFIALRRAETARANRPRINHRIGVNLPLHLSDYKPRTTSDPKELLRTVKENAYAVLGLMTKLIGSKSHDTMLPNTASPLRVITVTTSQLIGYDGDLTPLLKFANIKRLAEAAAFGMSRAYGMCRNHGKRLVWIHDLAINESMLQMLRSIFHQIVPMDHQGREAVFKIALYRSELRQCYDDFADQYHTLLDLNIFSVIDDISTTDKERSAHLTYCMTHRLPLLMRFRMLDVDWLRNEKKRVWQSKSPLMIIEREFKLTRSNIDKECRFFMPLCRHSDVLIWRP